jgi:hypothetical protein
VARALHGVHFAMKPIRDALELLTAQHEELDELCARVARSKDAATFDLLADRITHHLAIEQELLYPVVGAQVSRDVMNEIGAEHTAIKQLLANLVWRGVEDERFDRGFDQLCDLLLGHSSWQEDQLFTTAAETVSPERLALLCDQLVAFETQVAAAA